MTSTLANPETPDLNLTSEMGGSWRRNRLHLGEDKPDVAYCPRGFNGSHFLAWNGSATRLHTADTVP